MINFMRKTILGLVLLVVAQGISASDMLMARVTMKADLAIEYLKTSLEEHGYSIAHIQLCDGGMEEFGYKSDFYRVIFFGKGEEVRRISKTHPEMAAFMPLKVAVIAEKKETLLTIVNPMTLAAYFPNNEMQMQFSRWFNDIQSIFDDMHKAAGQEVAVHFHQ